MNIQHIFLLILYAILAVILATVSFRVKMSGGELFCKPTINLYLQLFGKFAILLPSGYLFLQAIGFELSRVEVPAFLQWIALFIAFEAMLFLYFSLWQLGLNTKVGLPRNDDIRLRTSGIYRLSRNPMYMGLILLAVASAIYVPNPVNIAATVTGIGIQHLIILGEEKFLTRQFGERYKTYKQHTRRYL